jgi:hypothetical protein
VTFVLFVVPDFFTLSKALAPHQRTLQPRALPVGIRS